MGCYVVRQNLSLCSRRQQRVHHVWTQDDVYIYCTAYADKVLGWDRQCTRSTGLDNTFDVKTSHVLCFDLWADIETVVKLQAHPFERTAGEQIGETKKGVSWEG